MESDPRFPSGPWTGFFTDRRKPGKNPMTLRLDFELGRVTGSGTDYVGRFTVAGAYNLADGECKFLKQYVGKHAVEYRGFNEGKGIWGTWELHHLGLTWTGGFHIWPEAMGDPTAPHLAEAIDEPVEVEPPTDDDVPDRELVPAGA